MGRRKSIQQALLGNLDSCLQSNETRTHPHTMHKYKLQMAERLKYTTGHPKLLEENIGKTLSDINLMNIFSGQSPKATNKSKNKPMGPNQTEKLLHSKGNQKENKNTTYRMEKIVSNDAMDKGLISKIYKQFYTSTAKKPTT